MSEGRERKGEREALGNEKWTAPPLPSLMKFSGTESHCLEIPWTFYLRDVVLLLFFPPPFVEGDLCYSASLSRPRPFIPKPE